MTLAAENLALKAENERLRAALGGSVKQKLGRICEYHNEVSMHNFPCPVCEPAHSLIIEVIRALAHPTPTTPETDKAQAVIDAACKWRYSECDHGQSLGKLYDAVEAYRGTIDD